VGIYNSIDMKRYITITGFLKAVKSLSKNNSADMLKGYDELPKEGKELLKIIIYEMDGDVSDLERIIKETKNARREEGEIKP
jgi:hypothetical protein